MKDARREEATTRMPTREWLKSILWIAMIVATFAVVFWLNFGPRATA